MRIDLQPEPLHAFFKYRQIADWQARPDVQSSLLQA